MCASAFVLVTCEAVNTSGDAVTSAHEFRIGFRVPKRQSNVNLYLSSFPLEKICFHTQICKMENAKKYIEEAFWIL